MLRFASSVSFCSRGLGVIAIVDIHELSNPDQLANTNPIRVKPGVAHARDTSLAEIRIPGQRL